MYNKTLETRDGRTRGYPTAKGAIPDGRRTAKIHVDERCSERLRWKSATAEDCFRFVLENPNVSVERLQEVSCRRNLLSRRVRYCGCAVLLSTCTCTCTLCRRGFLTAPVHTGCLNVIFGVWVCCCARFTTRHQRVASLLRSESDADGHRRTPAAQTSDPKANHLATQTRPIS